MYIVHVTVLLKFCQLGLIPKNMLPLESNSLKPKIVRCLEKTGEHLKKVQKSTVCKSCTYHIDLK